ncbi:MAG: hypothetical protein ACH37Z_16785 [Anaerolineae bacterium]
MTYDQHVQRSSRRISPPAADSTKRDDRFSWLLYLIGGRTLLGGALMLFLGFALFGDQKEPWRAAEGGSLLALVLIPGLYGIIMGFLILGRLRVAWVLLVVGRTLGLAIQLMTLGVESVSTMAQRLNGAAGTDILSASYFGAALSVVVLIFLLGRKNWFYR